MVNQKETFRSETRTKIEELTPEERIVADAHIATQVTHLSYWDNAKVVAGYMAMDDEVDVQAILRAAFRAGKTIALPYVENSEMVMRQASQYPRGLQSHSLGFLQPSVEEPIIDDLSDAVIIVPGRAFDRSGRRIGRGRGYYDRFLAQRLNVLAIIGVCYSAQFYLVVPTGPEDVSVQIVVTDSETCFARRPEKN